LLQKEIVGKFISSLISQEDGHLFGGVDRPKVNAGQEAKGEEISRGTNSRKRNYWSLKIPLYKKGEIDSYIGISIDVTEVVHLMEEYRRVATTDALTGISSRRHLLESAELELKRTRRRRDSLAVIVFDIDNFKVINDSYGHATGDRSILAVVESCKKNLREIDLFGRMGGDEFVVISSTTDMPGALRIAERLRQGICEIEIICEDGSPIEITSSFGLALSTPKCSLEDLLSKADAALYGAKNHGRNCVWHEGKTLI
jgi:diguanylate cyclase (GGDEF)-like protein